MTPAASGYLYTLAALSITFVGFSALVIECHRGHRRRALCTQLSHTSARGFRRFHPVDRTGNRTLRVLYQDPPARHSDELSVDGANPVGYRRLDRGWARASGIILDVTAAEARGTKPTFGILQCTGKPRKSGVAEGSIRLILPTSCRRRGSGILATRAVRLS